MGESMMGQKAKQLNKVQELRDFGRFMVKMKNETDIVDCQGFELGRIS